MRGDKGSGTVGSEAVVTGSRNGRLRARQARLRCLRAPEDRHSRRAKGDAAGDVRCCESGAHDTAGLVSHLLVNRSSLPSRPSAAVAHPGVQRVQINRSAIPLKENGVPLESWTRETCVVLANRRRAWCVPRAKCEKSARRIKNSAYHTSSTTTIGTRDAFGVRLLISRESSRALIQSE